MAGLQRTYDVFITHSWRYHDDWSRMAETLNSAGSFRWRNFSVPWYDPALDPNTKLGEQLINTWLESQIIPADAVIFLDSVYAVKSARKWLDKEIKIARNHGKPILAVPTFGADGVSPAVEVLVDAVLPWNAGVLVWNIIELSNQRLAA